MHWTEGGLSRGYWSVTKLEDVQAVYRDAATYKSGYGLPSSAEMEKFDADPQKGAREKMLVSSNAPFHTGLRKAFVGPFLQRMVMGYEEPGRRLVAEIIDDVLPRGECDFVMDVAAKLPMAIICDMMQIPRADWAQMFRWANMAMAAEEDPEYQIEEAERRATKNARLHRDLKLLPGLRALRPAAAIRATNLLGLISDVKVDGRQLTEEEVGHDGFMFVIGELKTSDSNPAGGGSYANPGQMRLLREDRALMRGAIQEIVRWTSPIVQLMRVATRDTELRGRRDPQRRLGGGLERVG